MTKPSGSDEGPQGENPWHVREAIGRIGYPSVKAKFERLKSEWILETEHLSNLRQIVLSSPYQSIIGIGPPVLPLLLDELKTEPRWWFWALEHISGENPVPEEHRGDIAAMTADWLKWAESQGF